MLNFDRLRGRLMGSVLFRDSFWALAGNVFGRGLALLASIVIARMLGKDLFGMYGLVRTTLLSVAIFSTFGLGYTATKFVAQYLQQSPDKVRSLILQITQITLITGALFAVLVFIFAPSLAALIDSDELYESIRYLAIIIFLNSITTTQTGILAGFRRFKELARINLINGVITFVLGVVLTYYYSLNGALLALLISQAYNALQNYVEVRRNLRTLAVEHVKVSVKRELVAFSLPVAMQEMVYSISSWIFPVLLVRFSDVGQVGLYNAAAQWSSVILFIPGALQNVIFAHLSSAADDATSQQKIVKRMLMTNFVATAIPFVVVWSLSSLIVRAYGPSFASLGAVLNIAVFSAIFTCMSSVFLQNMMATNRVWLSFFIRFTRDIFGVALFILLSYYGDFSSGALCLVMTGAISQAVLFLLLWINNKNN